MRYRKLGLLLGLAVIAIAVVGTASAASGGSTSSIPVIPDSQLHANFTEIGGGSQPLPTARTIPHWFGSTLDPHDGITYGYSMVGADPNSCSGSACSTTIQADITPLIVNVGGMTFSGSDVLAATLASPQFATNDYGSTPFATAGAANVPRGPGGVLSQGDAGNQLQLEDATMRAQFNQTGSSSYHLMLHYTVLPTITINVPSGAGVLLQSGRGVVFADVDAAWWGSRIQTLMQSSNPLHLPLFWTNNVLLHS